MYNLEYQMLKLPLISLTKKHIAQECRISVHRVYTNRRVIQCTFKNQTKILLQILRKDSKLVANHQGKFISIEYILIIEMSKNLMRIIFDSVSVHIFQIFRHQSVVTQPARPKLCLSLLSNLLIRITQKLKLAFDLKAAPLVKYGQKYCFK